MSLSFLDSHGFYCFLFSFEQFDSAPSQEEPLQVLKMRLAKGEITKQEYEQLREALQSS
jgi:uncharacterized membrane protein